MSKSTLEWSKLGEDEDFEAARRYLSLLSSDSQAKTLVRKLRQTHLTEHPAKDLLRAAQLPLLPSDDPRVADDLKKIAKGKSLSPVLLVRGAMAHGFPLVVADGYHRICAVVYFDESAPVACRIVDRPTPARLGR
jgi:hypothetical protein